MAKIPPIKTISENAPEFQGENSWIKKLISPLSDFMTDVANALNRNLTFQDNHVAQIDERTILIDDGEVPYPFAFQWSFTGIPPKGCIILEIDSTDGVESVFSAVMPKWGFYNGRVMIYGLRGQLTLGKYYKIRFLTFA